jgi:hypothetical protein
MVVGKERGKRKALDFCLIKKGEKWDFKKS